MLSSLEFLLIWYFMQIYLYGNNGLIQNMILSTCYTDVSDINDGSFPKYKVIPKGHLYHSFFLLQTVQDVVTSWKKMVWGQTSLSAVLMVNTNPYKLEVY